MGLHMIGFKMEKKSSLHLAIDNALVKLYVDDSYLTECLEEYVKMLEILVTKYGIPENIYCDKHTILISPIDGNLTNFTMCAKI